MEDFLKAVYQSDRSLIAERIQFKPALIKCSIANQSGWTPLHLAVALNLPWLIDEIAKVEDFQDHIDKVDDYGWSASHLAISLGKLEIFKKLHGLGANLNVLTTTRHESTLFFALRFNQIDILEYISTNHSEHINTLTNYQESPLTICISNDDNLKLLLKNYVLSNEELKNLKLWVSGKQHHLINEFFIHKKATGGNIVTRNKSFLPIKIAVFQGGGVKGLAFYGALKELVEEKILDLKDLKIVAGTSAGAITAMLLAVGYDMYELRTILYGMQFKELLDFELREKFLEIKNKVFQKDGLKEILGKDLYDFLFTNIQDLARGEISIKELLLQIITNYLAEKNNFFNSVTVKLGLHENTLRKIRADATNIIESLNPFLEALKSKRGIFSGDALRETFVKWLKNKDLEENLTFSKLNKLAIGNKKYKDLYIVSYNASTKATMIFSHETTPDAIIVDAVRSSMSIQIVFVPHKYYVNNNGVREIHKDYQDDYFFDGGSLDNYILSIFDKKHYLFEKITDNDELDDKITNKNAIGFRLLSPELYSYYENCKNTVPKPNHDSVFSFIKDLIFSVTSFTKQENDYSRNPDEIKRSIHINTQNIDTLDFDITDEGKQKLEEFGREGTRNFLRKYGYSQTPENLDTNLIQTTTGEMQNISASSNHSTRLRLV